MINNTIQSYTQKIRDFSLHHNNMYIHAEVDISSRLRGAIKKLPAVREK